MSELTDDQKRSIEKNDQKDVSRDDHSGTESQGKTFRESIAGLKDTVKEKASDLKETVSEKASDLKDSVKEKASDLKETTSEKASDLKDTLKEKASDLKDSIKNEISNLKDISKDKASQAIIVASFTAFTNLGGHIEAGIHNRENNTTQHQVQLDRAERGSPSEHTNPSSSPVQSERTIIKKPDAPTEPPAEPPEDADDEAGKVRDDIEKRRGEINEAIRRVANG